MRSIEIEQEGDEYEIVKLLCERDDLLQGASLGVAKQVVSKGRESLSRRQQYVFQRYIADEYFKMKCGNCGVGMPTSDVVIALMEGDDWCGDCQHMWEVYQRD